MNNKLTILTLGVLLISAGPGWAAEGHDHDAAMNESKKAEVGNKICPVGGGKVGEMGDPFKVEYNGKMYNLCCAMCKKDFLNDPEKFSAIAHEEVNQSSQGEDSADDKHAGHDHAHE